MLIDRRSLNDMPDRTAACKPPLCYIHRARTHSHDEVIVIENPFRRNFDTVADSPSCLLSNVPACLRNAARFRNELLSRNKNSDAPLRRETPYETERIVPIKFD